MNLLRSGCVSLSRAVAVIVALGVMQTAAARQSELHTWFGKELIPYVAAELTSHPRFKGETVRFVIFRDDNPEPLTSALGLELLDQLRDATAELPGAKVVWQATPASLRRSNRASGIDCSAGEIDYYIGLELNDGGQGNLNVRVRALDIAERSWVAGFGKEWYGPLSHSQRRALQQIRKDNSFLGEREVPYSIEQTDLLATHLAHDLGCLLLSELSNEYSIASGIATDVQLPLDSVVELVSNNLSAYRALQVTPDDERANSLIEGKAHQIDGGLFQYWVTVKPKNADVDVPSLSTSVYILLPQQYVAAIVEPEIQQAIWKSESDLLSSIRIVGLDSQAQCAGPDASWNERRVYDATERSGRALCYALQVTARQDSVLFFLNHQVSRGLLRLAGRDCDTRTHARVARQDERVRLSLPMETVANVTWKPADGWNLNPDTDTYVAIAVSDTIAARAIAAHLQRLPARCTESVRVGLEGTSLRAWTRDLIAIIENWQTHIDWESVSVKNVY